MRWLVAVALAMLALAPAAEAKKFFGGVVPDVVGTHPAAASRMAASPTAASRMAASPIARAANLPYGGGAVLHSNRTHAIFWAPRGSGLGFDGGYTSLIGTFLRDVAMDSHKQTNPYSLSGQYHDSGGPAAYKSQFAGGIVVTDPLPANGCVEPLAPPLGTGPGWSRCVDDQQLEEELNHVVETRHLPHTQRDVYFLITPSGLGSCEFTGPDDCALGGATPGGYCGYHSSTPDGLPYAVIPFNAVSGHCQSTNPRPNASAADPAISTVSHEHNEIVTDPFGDAWIDASSLEDGDLCIQSFGPALGGAGSAQYNAVIHRRHYWIQEEWSNADGGCEPRAKADRVSLTAPGHGRAGRRLPFSATGHAPQARIVSYLWFFGDGKVAAGRRPHHAFKRAGTYRVVVRATDSWDNWVLSARAVKIGKALRHHRRQA